MFMLKVKKHILIFRATIAGIFIFFLFNQVDIRKITPSLKFNSPTSIQTRQSRYLLSPQKLVTPETLQSSEIDFQALIIRVPVYWNGNISQNTFSPIDYQVLNDGNFPQVSTAIYTIHSSMKNYLLINNIEPKNIKTEETLKKLSLQSETISPVTGLVHQVYSSIENENCYIVNDNKAKDYFTCDSWINLTNTVPEEKTYVSTNCLVKGPNNTYTRCLFEDYLPNYHEVTIQKSILCLDEIYTYCNLDKYIEHVHKFY